jgi:hypothetical protein
MKQMTIYRPTSSADTLTITASTAQANFPASNLKDIQPSKCWKSTVITDSTIKYDFGSSVAYNGLFLNRFNFAEFYIETSPDNSVWTEVAHVDNAAKDEIADENYMHYYIAVTTASYRYIRVRIPYQTPLFEPTYFKIGNMLVGNFETIWNPKAGFSVVEVPRLSVLEFPTSGYMSVQKVGKTRRTFSGNLDKFDKTEYDKIVKTYQPFVLFLEFDDQPSSAYLVRANDGYARDYFQKNTLNMAFKFDEII